MLFSARSCLAWRYLSSTSGASLLSLKLGLCSLADCCCFLHHVLLSWYAWCLCAFTPLCASLTLKGLRVMIPDAISSRTSSWLLALLMASLFSGSSHTLLLPQPSNSVAILACIRKLAAAFIAAMVLFLPFFIFKKSNKTRLVFLEPCVQ